LNVEAAVVAVDEDADRVDVADSAVAPNLVTIPAAVSVEPAARDAAANTVVVPK
jgi:hypothetical protein